MNRTISPLWAYRVKARWGRERRLKRNVGMAEVLQAPLRAKVASCERGWLESRLRYTVASRGTKAAEEEPARVERREKRGTCGG